MMSRISLLVCALALMAGTVRAEEAPPAPPPPPVPEVVPAVPAVPRCAADGRAAASRADGAAARRAGARLAAVRIVQERALERQHAQGRAPAPAAVPDARQQLAQRRGVQPLYPPHTAPGCRNAVRPIRVLLRHRLPEPVPGNQRSADRHGQCHHHQGHAGNEHPGRLHHLEGVRRHDQVRRRLHAAADGPQRRPGSGDALFLGLLRVLVPQHRQHPPRQHGQPGRS